MKNGEKNTMAKAAQHKLLKNSDPAIDSNDYDSSIARATNYLNVNYDAKDRVEWVKIHYPKTKFGNHRASEFQILATLCRLTDNGNELSDKHNVLMQSEFDRLIKPGKKVEEVVEDSTPKVSIQEKMDDKVSSFLGEFAGLVDDYITTRNIPNVVPLINSMGIRGPMVSKVISRIGNTMQELRDAIEGADKQLVEGYSNFKKIELKRLLGIYESLETALGQAKVLAVKKPRKTKVKPPALVAKSVKYCLTSAEYELKSLYPVNVVGSSEVWLFNAKTRKLTCYKSSDGFELTFKGSTLMNWDTEKSSTKTIRKPLELSKLVGQGTRAWSKYFKENTSKPSAPSGRFNEDSLILGIIK
jgi:hypothetical protein